jgi:GR25 family glycosyltransferase involved in LPS biosynthesis
MKLQDMFPLIVYINLDSRPDRRKEAEKEFEKLGIDPVRIPGQVYSGTNNKSWNGIIGCMQSHLIALSIAKEANCNIMIFEDDVKFINDAEKVIPLALDELSALDWHMQYFGANLLKPCYQVTPHLARLTHGQSTHAYGVNVKFIDKLLTYIPLNEICPIDLRYANNAIPNNSCFITIPMVAVQRDSYSDIEGVQANYESYLERRFKDNLRVAQAPRDM